jgi:predicted outer membrane repeat protein
MSMYRSFTRLFHVLQVILVVTMLFSQLGWTVGNASAAPLLCYADAGAAGLNDGSSWANAYTNLQSALGASPCTEVWVKAGTYKPGTVRTATFQLKNLVALYGGFAGTETLLSQRNWQTNLTILSGDIGVVNDTSDNSYHVVTGVTGATLDGFTITGGNANGSYPNTNGGGMYNSSSSPTLANVTFSSNAATDGGGMFNDTSSPSLANVTFSGNSATLGGGMFNEISSPSLTKVTFSSNSAATGGGGMYNDYGSPILANVTFSGNSATGNGGGGMYNVGSNVILTNVTFSGNSATGTNSSTGNGGGLYNYNNSSSNLTNVTFSANSATSNGGGIYNLVSNPSLTNVTFSANSATSNGGGIYNLIGSPVIKDSLFWGDGSTEISNNSSSPVIYDSLIQGGCPAGATCNGTLLTTNPLLGALANNGGFTQTMALLSGSPAIDAGNNLTCAATDQRGVARPKGTACDIGAYEYIDTTEVSLASFTAQVEKKPAADNGKSVLLSWTTASEVDNLGFNLYRAIEVNGARVKLNAGLIPTLVPPGSLFGADYRYTDSGLAGGTSYYYWLEAVDIHGGKELTGPAWVKLVVGKK